jgi:radical SAM protein with 4Fe4S-binding SPASM domain
MLDQPSSFIIGNNTDEQPSVSRATPQASQVMRDSQILLFAPSTPTTYTLELTSHCNELCLGCGNNNLFTRHDPYLSGSQWIELLEKVKPYARYVRLTGGECTLHPDFKFIASHLDTFDIPFTIFTNGIWHDSQDILSFLTGLRNLSALLISLHGSEADIHNAFTGSQYFELTVANIRRATLASIPVDTNTVLMRCNFQNLESIVKLSSSLGARCAVFSRYYGANLPIVDLTDDELAEAVQTVDRLRGLGYATKVNPCIPECFIASSSGGCGAGVTLCTVDPMGNVRPCNHAPVFMGNLNQMAMTEIWASSEAFHWRSLVPEGCSSCSAFPRCRGGCRATALQRDLAADPLMRGAISEPSLSPLRVFAGLRPIRKFDIRHENEGALLTRYNHVVSVTSRGLDVAEAMDGNSTLDDLKQRYGQESVELAIALYEQGFINLED